MIVDAMFEKYGKTYPPNRIIFCEHEPGDKFYLINDGHVKIVKIVDGAEKTLDVFGPGDIFGEMAILEQQPRSATVITLDTVSVLEFNKQNFELLLKSNPAIALRLIKMFCKRIYDARRQLEILSHENLEIRVADVLVMLAEKQGLPDSDESTHMDMPVTRETVANMAGISVDEATKYLTNFSRQGKIELFEHKISVLNIGEFQRMIKMANKKRSEDVI